MDTLSSSVSSFKLPALHSTPREIHNFKAPITSHHQQYPLPPHPQLSFKAPSSSSTHSNFTTTFPFFSPSKLAFSLPIRRRKAASGYAAALLDAARSHNTLEALERDVRRFSKLLRNERVQAVMNDPFVDETEKGQIVKEVAERGKFHRHLVALVKMLVNKGKLGIVGEVLGEFETIYGELCGTRVVLVSSA